MIRRLWPVAVFCILALLVALGTSVILSQARKNVLLIRLPKVPPLSGKNEVLREKIAAANADVRKKLDKKGVGPNFGKAVGELGRLYQANHFYDQALSCYRLALEYDKQSAQWYYLTASVHQQRGETESMIGFLRRTLSLSGEYSPAVLKLADTYFKAGEMHPAQTYYEKRLALQPGDPYALMGLARIAMDQARWDIAAEHLQKAIASDPRFGDAHRLMAEVYERQARIEAMKQSLEVAANCTRFRPAPDPWIDDLENLCYDPKLLLVLGSMALSESDIETAVNKHFAKALKIDPENPAVQLAIGKAWLMAGEWARAHPYLVRTIELDPTSDEAYFNLGLILRRENKLQDAEAMLIKALAYQPDNVNVLNNLGVILLEQRKYADAIQSFTQALDIYPEHVNARYNLGMSLWAQGDSRAAVFQYRQVLEMKPDWGFAANTLAWILATDRDQQVRNGAEAVKWAQVALQGSNRENPEYLDTLAAALAETGQYEKAVQIARQALSIAGQSGNKELRDSIEGHLQRYQSGRPFHDEQR